MVRMEGTFPAMPRNSNRYKYFIHFQASFRTQLYSFRC